MSFDGSNSPEEPGEREKYALKRVEPALRKFITVLQIDLDRLEKHKQNIQKLESLGEYDALNKEQINASRTIQQLKSNIRQLENTRSQVRNEDLSKFDARVKHLQNQSQIAVAEFLNLHDQGSQSPLRDVSSNRIGIEHPRSLGYDDRSMSEDLGLQAQTVLEKDSPSEQSWNNLCEDLVELNDVIHDFATLVDQQQEKVDQIESNVETAQENVHQGVIELAKASKWKAAAFPLAGAVLGGMVGGPVGFVAGIKLGGLAAVGGGLAGFTGGTLWKKRQDKITNIELQNLSDSRSKSLPELSSSCTQLPKESRDPDDEYETLDLIQPENA